MRYLHWLMELVGCTPGDEYESLFDILNRTTYTWSVPMDENRAADGLQLREMYRDETRKSAEMPEYCSVLEMLIGLSVRMERDITGEPGAEDYGKWLRTMLINLGLVEKRGPIDLSFSEIHEILDTFLDRKYGKRGENGGLFPLKHCPFDSRETEIWSQMQAYLSENWQF